jgi:PAS domain S-box-containing protein
VTPEVLAALRTIVADVGADAGALVRIEGPGRAIVTSSTLRGAVSLGESWVAADLLADEDLPTTLVTDHAQFGQFVPTGFRLALPADIRGVVVASVVGTPTRVVLVWCLADPPPDAVARLESGAFEGFTMLAPLLDAQVQAQSAAARLRAVVGSLEQAVVVIDGAGQTGEVNAAAAALLGLDEGTVPADRLTASMRELRRRSTRPAEIEARAERLLNDPTMVVRDWIWTLDGSPSHLRVNSAPISDIGVSGRVWVFDDISAQMDLLTAEQRARAAVAMSEERYRLLAENVSDVVVVGDTGGLLTWVSPSVTAAMGWQPSELEGLRFRTLVHPEDIPLVDAAAPELDRSEAGGFEVRLRSSDGSYRWMNVRAKPILDESGTMVGRVAGWWDAQDQHLARTALARSEARYRMLVENASDIVFHTIDGVVDWVSPSLTSILGWEQSELVGRTTAHLWHPGDLQAAIVLRDRVYSGEEGRGVFRFRTKGGAFLWMEVALRPYAEEGGGRGAVGLMHDVSARVLAEEEAEQSELRYRLLAENASDVVFQVSPDLTLAWVSPSVREMTGRAPEELVGRPSTALVFEQDLPQMVEAMTRGSESGRIAFRTRYQTADGHLRWAETTVRSVYGPSGAEVSRVGSMRDVHEQAMAEHALSEAEERYRLVAENATDVVCRYTPDGVIDWAFGSTEALVGLAPDELVGTRTVDHLLVDDLGPSFDTQVAALTRGETVSGLIRLKHPDGSTHWIDRRTRAVLDDRGAMLYVVSAWRDAQAEVDYRNALTASQHEALDLASRYEVARNEAMEANLAKTAFLSRMSHELRTPLNAVLGFAQLLSLDPLSEDQLDAVQHIRTGGRHLLDLINEILDISRIEAGRLTLSTEPVHVGDAVGEALDLVRPIATDAGITVDAAGARTSRTSVVADRQRMIQVLLNLLTNAVKYNRADGQVTVSVETLADGMVAVRVADTGTGIPPEYLDRLFQPFDRLGAETTGVEGTGIGLTLSEGLARLMGGRIDVETSVGEGSVFTLVLPPASAPLPRSEGAAPTPAAAPDSTVRILYIEDNVANAELMTRIVALRPGAALRLASDGEGGLRWARSEVPDLVFLDLHLPDMSGDQVLSRLRHDPVTAAVPVVVVTADASPEVRQRALRHGATGVLTKPVDVPDVLAWIDHPNGPSA